MDIQLPLVNLLPARPEIKGISGLLAQLAPGQQIEAVVESHIGEHDYLLRLGDGAVQLWARSQQPLETGKNLTLQVVEPGTTPKLKIVPPTVAPAERGEAVIQQAVREYLPKRASLAELPAALQRMVPLAAEAPALQAALQELERRLPQQSRLATPEGLRQAVRDSGLFLEAGLVAAGGQPGRPPAAADLKAGLLAVVDGLRRQLQASEPEEGAAADAAEPEPVYPRRLPLAAEVAARLLPAAAGSGVPPTATGRHPESGAAATRPPVATESTAAGREVAPADPSARPPAAADVPRRDAADSAGGGAAAPPDPAPAVPRGTGAAPAPLPAGDHPDQPSRPLQPIQASQSKQPSQSNQPTQPSQQNPPTPPSGAGLSGSPGLPLQPVERSDSGGSAGAGPSSQAFVAEQMPVPERPSASRLAPPAPVEAAKGPVAPSSAGAAGMGAGNNVVEITNPLPLGEGRVRAEAPDIPTIPPQARGAQALTPTGSAPVASLSPQGEGLNSKVLGAGEPPAGLSAPVAAALLVAAGRAGGAAAPPAAADPMAPFSPDRPAVTTAVPAATDPAPLADPGPVAAKSQGALPPLNAADPLPPRLPPPVGVEDAARQELPPLQRARRPAGHSEVAAVATAEAAPRPQAELKALLQRAEGALASIVLDQLASLPVADGRQAVWQLEIPYRMEQYGDALRLRVERDGKPGALPAQCFWAVTLELHPPGLGTVHARISLSGGIVDSYFWSDRPATAAAIQSHLDLLAARLEGAGLRVGRLDTLPQPPTAGERPPPVQVLLDERA